MPTNHRAALASIRRFDQLIAYLRDEMDWPIEKNDDFEDLTFDYAPDELGIDPKSAAKIQEIKRLRPLSPRQPWGIFFVKFEPKRLPVVALRRILSRVAIKKRTSANSAERAAWAPDDLLFVSNYGEGDERQISFAHFSGAEESLDLPTLKVLGWDSRDTALHLDAVAHELCQRLAWPKDDGDTEAWRNRWRAAFTLGHRQVITTSKELSIRLAELARSIRDRIQTVLEIETEKGPLTQLMKAFQGALIHDLKPDGFADMYAQTIAYGLLSARIADPQKKSVDDFAAHMRTNPFLRELMETFLKVGGRRGKAGGPGIDFDELGVSEVVQLLDDANMEAVVRDFGDRNPQEDPVIHFYELFLKEYDAKKRMQRGVFYTPRPVVSYIVRSVHELLQTEFGLADGLADTTTWAEMVKRHEDLKIPEGTSPDQDFVQILDPATGTGTFLVEVIDLIHQTLVAKWKAQGHGGKKIDALWNEYVPKHLLTRLHGYELLMAPYAIAHLKIGLKLYETGYRFDSEERARVYLTNALEPEGEEKSKWSFKEWIPALAHESAAVDDIKRLRRFTVVIGNPPYSGTSSNFGKWISQLVNDYYFLEGKPLGEKNPKYLQDDYVKFIRLGQYFIHATGCGVFSFITNHGYMTNPTFRGMRHLLLRDFNSWKTLDLHGSTKRREQTENGKPDENVFDIQQGVAIFRAFKRHDSVREITHADLYGDRATKYKCLTTPSNSIKWQYVSSVSPFYLFQPQNVDIRSEYFAFTSIADLMPYKNYGFKTHRDDIAVAFTEYELVSRLDILRSKDLSNSDVLVKFNLTETRDWKIQEARQDLRAQKNWKSFIVKCLYRPLDYRFCYLSNVLMDWPRLQLMRQLLAPNLALSTTRSVEIQRGFEHIGCVNLPMDHHAVSLKESNFVFPLYVYPVGGELIFDTERQPNFDQAVIILLCNNLDVAFAVTKSSTRSLTPEDIFHYIYAVFHSPGYRSRYAEFLKIDFPRLPLTESLELFRALARLGSELVALHLMESPRLDQPMTEFIGRRDHEVEKVTYSNDTVWIDKAQTTGFRGVPENVWNFHIGGYQVCAKWLKDRKGRTLSADDLAHYQKIVVALSETIRLMQEIDEVIEQHGGWPNAFQTGEAKADPDKVVPFRPRTVEPKPAERYVTCVPLVPLKAAAGLFSDPQQRPQTGWEDGAEWVAVESRHRLRPGMFVAQVVGRSMEPAIPDGAWCLFRAPVEGTRQGKTVLVELGDTADPETGQRYTVKRYESEKALDGDLWRHERITLRPVNPEFAPIVLNGLTGDELTVVAELVEVLTRGGG